MFATMNTRVTYEEPGDTIMIGLLRFTGLVFGALLLTDAIADSEARCDPECRYRTAESIRAGTGDIGALLSRAAPDISSIRWSKDGAGFWYLRRTASGADLISVAVEPVRKRRVATLERLVERLNRQYGLNVDPRSLPLGALTYERGSRTATIVLDQRTYSFDMSAEGRVSASPASDTASVTVFAESPDGRFRVFTDRHDLYVESRNGDVRRLTEGGETWYSFDARLARSNPIDVPPGPAVPPKIHWIDGGPRFWVQRWDFRDVGSVWMVDHLARPRPALVTQKMAFPGDLEIPKPEIWIFDASSGHGTLIDGQGWAYLGNMDVNAGGVYPSRDGRKLYFARMTRNYSVVELCAADVETGDVKVLLSEERGRPFFPRFVEFRELADGFLWKSDRDGFKHYYRFTKNGELVRQVTSGGFSVSELLHVDENANAIFFAAYGDPLKGDPGRINVYRANLADSGIESLTGRDADHRPVFSPDGRFFVDLYSTVSEAPQLVLRDRRGRILSVLETGSTDMLESSGWRMPVAFEATAADGKTPLYGVMWLPFDFEPERKYPLIVNAYPGPLDDNVPHRFSPGGVPAATAQLGFVVVRLGHRGGDGSRDAAYQQYAREFGNVRDYPLQDNRTAIEQLALQYPFIDPDRVGIVGHSGGGFMAVAAMLAYPDLFKVGVASAGNHDNNIYEMNSSEYYFGNPAKGNHGSRRGYASNIDIAGKLEGELLLIHGDRDDDVNLAHTLRLARGLIDAGKTFDLLVLPGAGHTYSESLQPYVWRRTWEHLVEHLEP